MIYICDTCDHRVRSDEELDEEDCPRCEAGIMQEAEDQDEDEDDFYY